MARQQDFLLDFLSQEGQRAVGLIRDRSESETNYEENSQMAPAPPAQSFLSNHELQLVPCKRHAADDKRDVQESSSSALHAGVLANTKCPKLVLGKSRKVAGSRKTVVCFGCKVTKKGGVSIISSNTMTDAMRQCLPLLQTVHQRVSLPALSA